MIPPLKKATARLSALIAFLHYYLATCITLPQTTTMKLFTSLLAFAAAASSASAFTANSAFAPRSAIARPAASTSSLQMVADDAKVILVTGSSRGLGRSIAVELGKQGQKIVVNYAGSEGAAQETVQMIKDAGGDAIAVQANCKLQFVNNNANEKQYEVMRDDA